jgi:hypothetical protein
MFLASPETPGSLDNILLPVADFAARLKEVSDANSPSFLRGWAFLKFETTNEPASLPARAAARNNAPTIIVNTRCISLECLEDSKAAIYWLPIVLNQLCTEMLHETDEDGLFASQNWRRFRSVACMHASLTWNEAVEAAEREGVEFMADALAQALFVESGLHEMLDDRYKREGRALSA